MYYKLRLTVLILTHPVFYYSASAINLILIFSNVKKREGPLDFIIIAMTYFFKYRVSMADPCGVNIE